MKNYITGFLLAYTILITLFTLGMYNGQIASNKQACVEHVGVVPSNYIDRLEGKQYDTRNHMGLSVPLNGGTIALGVPPASYWRINQQCVGVVVWEQETQDLMI